MTLLALVTLPPEEVFQTIKAFAPQIGRITFATAGNVIALSLLAAQTNAKLEASIRKALRTRVKRNKSDDTQVIRVKDAIDCVEHKVWSARNLLTTTKSLVDFLTGGDVKTIANVIVQETVSCIRENALRQDTPRTKQSVTYFGRPAKGHGFGRKR